MSISTDQSDAFVVVHRETSPSILSWFEVEGSESFPWSQTRIQRVADARQRLGGALFFDELVNLAGLDGELSFVCRTAGGRLRRLTLLMLALSFVAIPTEFYPRFEPPLDCHRGMRIRQAKEGLPHLLPFARLR